jgi:hypothetical protein
MLSKVLRRHRMIFNPIWLNSTRRFASNGYHLHSSYILDMPLKFGSLKYKPMLYSSLAELSSIKAEIIGMNIAVSLS